MEPGNPAISPLPLSTTANSRDRILSWCKPPRGLLIGGIAVVAAGLGLGWNWVVALGLAPIVLALAPCALMCVFGLCAMCRGKPVNPPNTAGGSVQKAITELPPSRNAEV